MIASYFKNSAVNISFSNHWCRFEENITLNFCVHHISRKFTRIRPLLNENLFNLRGNHFTTSSSGSQKRSQLDSPTILKHLTKHYDGFLKIYKTFRMHCIVWWKIFQTVFFPAGNYMFKVKNKNTRTRCKVCSKLIIKTPERRHWHRSGVFIINSEHISHLVLVRVSIVFPNRHSGIKRMFLALSPYLCNNIVATFV